MLILAFHNEDGFLIYVGLESSYIYTILNSVHFDYIYPDVLVFYSLSIFLLHAESSLFT